MESYQALVDALVAVANDILQERIAPSEGAAALAAVGSSLRELGADLLVFTALDSDFDEHRGLDPRIDGRPERRAGIEHDIVVAADRFRSRYD